MKVFSLLFALLAICEFIGFILGHKHCLYASILIGALSAFIWWQGNEDLPKTIKPNHILKKKGGYHMR